MKYKVRNIFSKDARRGFEEILIDRGVKDVECHIEPSASCLISPYKLDNIEAGAMMLLRHLNNNSKILFVVDSDADGYTSSSILWLYIKELFPDSDLHFTIHSEKQHGLEDKIEWLEDEKYDLVICPDSASFDIKEQERLSEMGVDILILDHHEAKIDDSGNLIISTVERAVIINNQLSKDYGNKFLCGAGVVYKFCKVLDDIMKRDYADGFLDLVALGEISDVMSQTEPETRYLIKTGLKKIHNEGFRALIEAQSYQLKEKSMSPYHGLTPIDIAFYITPLINALVRVGTQKEKEVMFYAFVDPRKKVASTRRGAKAGDYEFAAEQTARVAGNARARQNKAKERAIEILDGRIHEEGLLDNNVLLIRIDEKDKIPNTLTGLIAAYFVTKYRRPVLLGRENSDGFLRGSIRGSQTFETVPDFKAFLEESGSMDALMGHANAAGYTIHIGNVKHLMKYANSELNADDFQEDCYTVDYIFDAKEEDFTELGFTIARHIDCFGNGIDEVKVVVKNLPLTDYFIMGKDQSSVRINYGGIAYVRFKDLNFIEATSDKINTIDIYGRFNLNEFRGEETLQIFIEDYHVNKIDKFSF